MGFKATTIGVQKHSPHQPRETSTDGGNQRGTLGRQDVFFIQLRSINCQFHLEFELQTLDVHHRWVFVLWNLYLFNRRHTTDIADIGNKANTTNTTHPRHRTDIANLTNPTNPTDICGDHPPGCQAAAWRVLAVAGEQLDLDKALTDPPMPGSGTNDPAVNDPGI